jgi:hypothetical protein
MYHDEIMITIQIIYYDRCKVRIERGRSLLRVESGPLRDRRESIDLCEACARALLESFLASYKIELSHSRERAR